MKKATFDRPQMLKFTAYEAAKEEANGNEDERVAVKAQKHHGGHK